MANVKFRAMSIFAGNKKVAEVENAKYQVASNDEQLFGDVVGGTLGFSDGAPTTRVDAGAVVPVPGMSYDFTSQLVAHNDIDIAVGVVNGQVHQITMRVLTADFESDQKTGVLKGTFTLAGGPPTITGA